MPPLTHSTSDEAAFMASLLTELDQAASHASPIRNHSSERSLLQPATPRRPPAPTKSPVKSLDPFKVFSAGEVDIAMMLEGSETWDMDDTFSESGTPKKEQTKHYKSPSYVPDTCTRCTVESVTQSDHNGSLQKNLIVKVHPREERRAVILRDDWITGDVRVGDIVNIIGTFNLAEPSTSSVVSSITITSKANLFIHHPDLLLTATALSNTPQCMRKPLLSSLVHSVSDTTPALLWGRILHEVMQSCLSEGRWETSWIHNRIDAVILQNLNELLKIDSTIKQAKIEVTTRAKGLLAFAERYISTQPKSNATLSNTRTLRGQGESLLAVAGLLDIEEDIWSPTYGIKGKLDATVNAIISDPNPPFLQPILSEGPIPLEIKTGRANAGMEHRAQTMLYTLLAAERYGTEVPAGLLYYTQSEEVLRVPASRNEIRGLIISRNELASYMMRRGGDSVKSGSTEPFLPPTIDDERICKRCYALDTCMLYRKAVENVYDTSSPIADTYDLKTSHITPSRAAFFKKWEALIALEEQDMTRFKKELWTMGAAEREKKGRCFSSMILDPSFSSSSPTGSGDKIHRFTYRFVRLTVKGSASLLNGHIGLGDAITVSVEPNLLALARGFIVELTSTSVVVGVDHKLSVDHIAQRLSETVPASFPIIFRVDKDELASGLGRIRDNLAQLFYADGDTRRLEFVVDLKTPTFDEQPSQLTPAQRSHTAHLNANQLQAMKKVLSAQDYALILGMPGTGKTTVIAAIIRTLVAIGKTVLLTSYTHSAVDTILAKLVDADFGILRLGNIDKIHPDVHKFTLNSKGLPTTIEGLEHILMTPPVVATTCLSIDHALFSRRQFDYCIIDEASQIALPTCLGPLRHADKFILVGDHFQLPPLIRNPAARKGGMDVSLFRRLSDTHPHAVVDLAYQYRMNADIMLLSNKLIYGGRLRCGSDAVAHQSLVLPNRHFLTNLHDKEPGGCHDGGCWIKTLMSENCKAVFVDTDGLPAPDSRVGDLVENKTEGRLVQQLTETLLKCGVEQQQIGVITLYRQQVKLLAHLLDPYKDVEILTADRSQGRDKDCIIISMVRSNDSGTVGDLVKDWRRINVSFTRARSKLIIIGSRKTLQKADLLSEFFNLMDSRGWVVRLPARADILHEAQFGHTTPDMSPNSSNKKKRAVEELSVDERGRARQENLFRTEHPQKRVKTPLVESGLLRGRPILKDLVNSVGM